MDLLRSSNPAGFWRMWDSKPVTARSQAELDTVHGHREGGGDCPGPEAACGCWKPPEEAEMGAGQASPAAGTARAALQSATR